MNVAPSTVAQPAPAVNPTPSPLEQVRLEMEVSIARETLSTLVAQTSSSGILSSNTRVRRLTREIAALDVLEARLISTDVIALICVFMQLDRDGYRANLFMSAWNTAGRMVATVINLTPSSGITMADEIIWRDTIKQTSNTRRYLLEPAPASIVPANPAPVDRAEIRRALEAAIDPALKTDTSDDALERCLHLACECNDPGQAFRAIEDHVGCFNDLDQVSSHIHRAAHQIAGLL